MVCGVRTVCPHAALATWRKLVLMTSGSFSLFVVVVVVVVVVAVGRFVRTKLAQRPQGSVEIQEQSMGKAKLQEPRTKKLKSFKSCARQENKQ